MSIPVYRPEELRLEFFEFKAKIWESDTGNENDKGRLWKELTWWSPYGDWVADGHCKDYYQDYGRPDKWYMYEWETTGKTHIGPPPGMMYSTLHF